MLYIINKPFKEIIPDEVFEYYDKPVLFSCTVAGLVYLAVLVHENNEAADWLFVCISPDRYRRIRAGNVNLYDAFKDAETGVVLKVRVDVLTDVVLGVIEELCVELRDGELPLRGEYLA